MTSIRQTKKAGKKLVAEGYNNIAERRMRHYSRVYKHFHKAMQKHVRHAPLRRLLYSKPTLSSLAGDGYRPIDVMPLEVKMLRDAVLQSTKLKIDSKK